MIFNSIFSLSLQTIEANWRCGRHNLQRIQCRSENSKGVYCLQYDDDKIISGLRDNSIKVRVCTSHHRQSKGLLDCLCHSARPHSGSFSKLSSLKLPLEIYIVHMLAGGFDLQINDMLFVSLCEVKFSHFFCHHCLSGWYVQYMSRQCSSWKQELVA